MGQADAGAAAADALAAAGGALAAAPAIQAGGSAAQPPESPGTAKMRPAGEARTSLERRPREEKQGRGFPVGRRSYHRSWEVQAKPHQPAQHATGYRAKLQQEQR